MRPEDFDLGNGTVTFWDLDSLDAARSLADQRDHLKEDLAQIQFGDELILDIGWYPEFSADGEFVVSLVRADNWDAPVFEQRVADVPNLGAAVARAVRTTEGRSDEHEG